LRQLIDYSAIYTHPLPQNPARWERHGVVIQPYPKPIQQPPMPTISTLVHRSICVTPLVDDAHGKNREIKGPIGSTARFRQTASNRRPITRSISDAIVASRARAIGDRTDNEIHPQTIAEGQPQIPLRPSQLSVQRASSSSHTNLRSRYHDPAITSAMLRRELTAQTRLVDQRPPQAPRMQSSPSQETSQENSEAIYIRPRSSSDPNLRKSVEQVGKQPLKPCMKKTKSTPTTPPGRPQEEVDDGKRILRRVKTVDFASKDLSPRSWEEDHGTACHIRLSFRENSSTNRNHEKTSCPGTVIKSCLADPAITRTAVHVIAIAPSWKLDEVPEDSKDPATPTMQIVESGSRRYEVVWEDFPAEHRVRLRQRRSTASHSLEAVSSPATRGLQRVNSKLTDWSGSWNSPSNSFKPTIVVFPDDDGRRSQYDCTVEDDDEIVVIAPPNSRMTSAGPSRLPSRPASAPMTRVASREDINLGDALREELPGDEQDWTLPSEQLVVPDPEVSRLPGSSRSLRQSGALRKLSNIEEADLKFRGHRDSITIAHSRLLHSGGVSPELRVHRDSVSMAKKRMHARNHAISGARDFPAGDDTVLPPLVTLDDDAASIISLSTVKEHAVEALEIKTSASIL
jgi:hypothetical protein